jgi:hypothetical protein
MGVKTVTLAIPRETYARIQEIGWAEDRDVDQQARHLLKWAADAYTRPPAVPPLGVEVRDAIAK